MKKLLTNKKVLISAACVAVAVLSSVVVVKRVKAMQLEEMVEDYCE